MAAINIKFGIHAYIFFSCLCGVGVESRVVPLVALKEGRLEIEDPAGTLIAGLARLLLHCMGRCIAAVYAISDRGALASSVSLLNTLVSLGCDVIVLVLRHLIAKPVDVVLEDKVINLTCVT